ncbi:nuclear transport factor 2 family protein [Streptomyces sp. NPDC051577]|uniref:nuclear transport factor 2 family protein n=1 Tax=Streptomyces sp. NPDC051577 TaxID=3155166 RepID=UPI003435D4CB
MRTLYEDLTRIGDYIADDVVYHLAHRGLGLGLPARVHGRQAVIDSEQALCRLTDGTLRASIDAIAANDFFAAVTGTFHADVGDEAIVFPFCGLWRFRDGLIVEHWQNAYDPAILHRQLASGPPYASTPSRPGCRQGVSLG